MSSGEAEMGADLVQRIAALGGLTLTPQRAAELVPGLNPLVAGDRDLRALGLEQQNPLAPLWPSDPA